jgi:hypothetical protein
VLAVLAVLQSLEALDVSSPARIDLGGLRHLDSRHPRIRSAQEGRKSGRIWGDQA